MSVACLTGPKDWTLLTGLTIRTFQFIACKTFMWGQNMSQALNKTGVMMWSSLSSESRGVAILFKSGLDYKIKKVTRDEARNLLILDLDIYGNPLIFIVLYDPNKDQPNVYSSLRDTLIEKANDPIIICGDWNLVLDFSIDTHNYICENNINSRKMVKELMCVLDLVDTWQSSNPRTKSTLGLVVQNQLKWPD